MREDKDSHLEVFKEHPAYNVLCFQPNTTHTHFQVFKNTIRDSILYGSGYIWIERTENYKIKALWYVPFSKVQITNKGWELGKDSIRYSVTGYGPVDTEDLIVIHYDEDQDGYGQGMFTFGKRTLGLSLSEISFAQDYFSSGCANAGIIGTDAPMTQEKKKDFVNSWHQLFGGADKKGIAILDSGMSYQSIASSAADAELLESRKLSKEDVGTLLGIDACLLGDLSKMSYSTLEQTMLKFVNTTLKPMVKKIQDELELKCLTPTDKNNGVRIRFNLSEIASMDSNSKADYMQKLINMGAATINEVRQELDRPHCDDEVADKVILQVSNLQPVNKDKEEYDTENIEK